MSHEPGERERVAREIHAMWKVGHDNQVRLGGNRMAADFESAITGPFFDVADRILAALRSPQDARREVASGPGELGRWWWGSDAPGIVALCERHGYGRVMQVASLAWAEEDPVGSFVVGTCRGLLPCEHCGQSTEGITTLRAPGEPERETRYTLAEVERAIRRASTQTEQRAREEYGNDMSALAALAYFKKHLRDLLRALPTDTEEPGR